MNPTSHRRPETSDAREPGQPRALVVRIGALGDVLLTRRLCHALSFAGFRSTLLAPARHAALLLADPWIDAILDSESPRFIPAFSGSWPEDAGTFEVAVLISNSADLGKAIRSASARLIQISPTPERLDRMIAWQWAEGAAIGPPFRGDLPVLDASAEPPIVTGATLLHPGSGSPGKNWPIGRFIELSQGLEARGHRVWWIRGPAESDFPREIPPDQVIELPSLPVLAATLRASALFIGNDSGVSHLAGAVGASSVVLFGPTDPVVWGPDGPRVQNLRAASRELSSISVAEVIAAADDLTRLPGGGPPQASPAGR